MTDAQVEKCAKRLQQFLADLLEPLGRSERKHWGEVYVRGLLLDGERKSIEPLAARVGDGNVQAMQQLVGQSPWDWMPVWERLAQRMTAELEPDSAWVIDDTGFPKQGEHSVGVERQYSGTLGKVGNCQVAVSVHHVGEQGHTILGWRLYLPESWTKDSQRREQAGIPDDVVFKTFLGFTGSHRGCRWRIRRHHRVSRRAGSSPASLCSGDLFHVGSVDAPAESEHPTTPSG